MVCNRGFNCSFSSHIKRGRVRGGFHLGLILAAALLGSQAIAQAPTPTPVCPQTTQPSPYYVPGSPLTIPQVLSYDPRVPAEANYIFPAYGGIDGYFCADRRPTDICNQTESCGRFLARLNWKKTDGLRCPNKVATFGKEAERTGLWRQPVRPTETCEYTFIVGSSKPWIGAPNRHVKFTNIGSGTCVLKAEGRWGSTSSGMSTVTTNFVPPTVFAPGDSREWDDIDHCGDGDFAKFVCGAGGAIQVEAIPVHDNLLKATPACQANPECMSYEDAFDVEILRSCTKEPSSCQNGVCASAPSAGPAGAIDQPVLAPVD